MRGERAAKSDTVVIAILAPVYKFLKFYLFIYLLVCLLLILTHGYFLLIF